MVSIVCALVLMSAHLQIEAPYNVEPALKSGKLTSGVPPSEARRDELQRDSLRALYALAAEAIAQGDCEAAIAPLEAMVEGHRDTALSDIAVFHLAECYLLLERPTEAAELLATWPYGRRGAKDNQTSTDAMQPDTRSLFRRSLAALPRDAPSLAQLETLIEQVGATSVTDQSANVKQRIELALEISRRYAAAGDFPQAQAWLERVCQIAGNDTSDTLRDQWQFRLPLAWAQHALAIGDTASGISLLKHAAQHELTPQQQIAVHFLLAEGLLAAGENEAASKIFEELARSEADDSGFPEWRATVDLRRSELFILARNYREAQRLLESSRQKYAHFSAAYEFDYLLARCAIANIDFEAARQYLQRVINAPLAADKEARARAGWMLGETYFLQHQFEQALACYQRVIDLAAFPTWQVRARLQSAKCDELLGRPDSALRTYTAIKNGPAEAAVAQEASARIAAIRSAIPNSR